MNKYNVLAKQLFGTSLINMIKGNTVEIINRVNDLIKQNFANKFGNVEVINVDKDIRITVKKSKLQTFVNGRDVNCFTLTLYYDTVKFKISQTNKLEIGSNEVYGYDNYLSDADITDNEIIVIDGSLTVDKNEVIDVINLAHIDVLKHTIYTLQNKDTVNIYDKDMIDIADNKTIKTFKSEYKIKYTPVLSVEKIDGHYHIVGFKMVI